MKKKLFVLLVILAVVLTGVFAAPAESNETAEVILKGNIGSLFKHGVVVNGALDASKEFTVDVLTADPPPFQYGYISNKTLSGAKVYMEFTDFKHSNGTDEIQIKDISLSSDGLTYDSGTHESGKGVLVFDGIANTGGNLTSKNIKVIAAQLDVDSGFVSGTAVGDKKSVASAPAGSYTATLTFSVEVI